MGQGEYPLTLFIDPQPVGCAKYGQKHLHTQMLRRKSRRVIIWRMRVALIGGRRNGVARPRTSLA